MGDLPEGLSGEEEVFDLDDDIGFGGVLGGDGVWVELHAGGFAVAVRGASLWESFLGDAAGHTEFIAAAEGGDLGTGGEAGDELEGGGGFV